jgi:heavy metal translocating P-type ATPase
MERILSFSKKLPLSSWVAIVAAGVLIIGGIFFWSGYPSISKIIFSGSLIILALPLLWEIINDLLHGRFGVDLIAGIAIVGSWFLGESLAGLVVVLMLSGGQALESFAMNKAKYELTQLLARAPRHALRKKDETYEQVTLEEIIPGDSIMIKSGEIIPVDGIVIEGISWVDESSLTGEPLPIEKGIGAHVASGTENTTGVLIIRAEKNAAESRYATIVALVKSAQESRAPLVRLADQYAVIFTGITLVVAAVTFLLFHDWVRVLTVLVVATPCPLILATPIALISGMSRAAQRGIIMKHAGSLEVLARVRTMLFDKTGTLTMGVPTVTSIISLDETYQESQLLGLAASLDHGSSHILARALERNATIKNIPLQVVEGFTEIFGQGVSGMIEGEKFHLGKASYLESQGIILHDEITNRFDEEKEKGYMSVLLAHSEKVIGMISFADVIRDDAKKVFSHIADDHVMTVMITGDGEAVANAIADTVGMDKVYASCTPEDKVRIVEESSRDHGPVVMIGDGINDAPALARADVGIALAQHGETATSDAADMVILSGSLGRVIEAYTIAQKTLTIARQGIWVGMGLSTVAMITALFGLITPLSGALLQEGIDVVVILGALRVLRVKV